MIRILLLGCNGQVGWELRQALARLGEVVGRDLPEINFCDPASLTGLVRSVRPHVIVNAAAYTAVDQAESEPEIVRKVNAESPGVLAEAARAAGAVLVHYSTDFVYDGIKARPYTEEDPAAPLSVYGCTKLAGDEAVQAAGGAYIILRSSWIYSLRGDNFLTRLLGWMRTHRVMRVVDDQVGCPTWARGVAAVTAEILAQGHRDGAGWLRERRGVYHLANLGRASRYDWAQATRLLDPRPHEQVLEHLLPASTQEFPSPAARPAWSVLDCSKLYAVFNLALPNWREGLAQALGRIPAPSAVGGTGDVP